MSFFDQFRIRTRSTQVARNRKADRIEALSVLVVSRPDDWAAANELADALAQSGRVDEAVTQLCALGDRLAAEGFLARAHAIYKKALRLQPQDRYAASRAAEVNTERMNQSPSRFAAGLDEARSIGATPIDGPVVSPPPTDAATVETAPSFASEQPCVSASEEHETAPPPFPAYPSSEATGPASDDAPKTMEEMVRAASLVATSGAIETAVSMLKECARTHPDVLEPVATLAEIAITHALADVRDEAEARLCDLHCRRGDYHAARSVAEALAMRYPDDPRHRARLEFVRAELDQCEGLDADVEVDGFEPSGDGGGGAAVENILPGETRAALERAAAMAEHCFTASRELARFDAAAGDWSGALAWLERAAAAIPGPEDEEALAYEIAVVLEQAGEHQRALGVLHEIAAKAGAEYRDVSERIVRLSSSCGAIRESLVAC